MKNPIKKLYNWILLLANSKNGSISLGIISFTEAIFFPIPPDILLIPLCIGNRKKIFNFFIICTIFSIIGAICGYFIGKNIWWTNQNQFSNIAIWFFDFVPGVNSSLFYEIKEKYDLYNFWIIFTAGFTPIPFKIFTISAGAFNLSFTMFFIASSLSRALRFLVLSTLIYIYGVSIKEFIDRYFNLLSVIFTILFISGFLLLKY